MSQYGGGAASALNTSTATGSGAGRTTSGSGSGGGGGGSSSYVSSSLAGPITLQSGAVNVAMPLPKQFGARPLSVKSRKQMVIRPMSAPTGLVKLAAELTAHQIGVVASNEAVQVLKPAIAQITKQTAVKQLHSAAVRYEGFQRLAFCVHVKIIISSLSLSLCLPLLCCCVLLLWC